eukprot:Lithocolla_globosa_v1_NODE_8503_length_813_cov_2.150396.p3 type:complete len:101 gc:universal NODE_8503_length_813_cov_2.150396:13-315(+)
MLKRTVLTPASISCKLSGPWAQPSISTQKVTVKSIGASTVSSGESIKASFTPNQHQSCSQRTSRNQSHSGRSGRPPGLCWSLPLCCLGPNSIQNHPLCSG